MKRRAWLIFLLLIFVGCSPANNNGSFRLTATNVPNVSSQPSVTSQPNISVQPSATFQPTSSISTTETLIQLEINQACIEINSGSVKNSEGVLVFQKEFGSRLVLVDNQTGNQKTVPDDAGADVWGAYVSPNRKWLLYELNPSDRFKENQFILTRADGIPQKEIQFGDWGVSSIFWFNNDTLRVSQPDNAVTRIANFALNPFDGTLTPLKSDISNAAGRGIDWGIDRNAIELGVSEGLNLIYDPTLTRVLYPRKDNLISLYDLETNEEIAGLSISGPSRLPKWSPDGQSVAIIGQVNDASENKISDEFWIFSRDGSEVKRFSYSSPDIKQIHIEDYSWSPDGSRIAFWLKTDTNTSTPAQNPFELAVLDLDENELTTYCIFGTSTIEHETYTDLVNIIWSPEGTQLLIVRYNNDHNKNTDEIIVDLMNETAHKVAENMQPIGWMIMES